MRATTMNAWLGAGLGAATAAAFFAVTSASADGLPGTETVPRVIPFAGELELDGQAYSGSVDLRLSLYDTATATAANARWTEVHDGVPVAAGHFSVLLGSTGAAASSGLQAAIADASTLYVGVEVKADAAPATSWVALSGKQLLGPSPYALWAPQAANLNVAGTLNVAGAASAASLSAGGKLYVDKSNAALTLGAPGAATRSIAFGDDTAGEGAQIVYQPNTNELSVQRGETGNGTKQLTIQGATGALTAAGAAIIGGAVSVDGDATLATSGTLALDGGFMRIGPSAKARKGISFGQNDATKGIKLVYDATAKTLAWEAGQNTTQDGADILSIDQSTNLTTVHGDLSVGRHLFTAVAVWSSATKIESGTDKSYVEDSSCTPGAIHGISANGGSDCDDLKPEAGMCFCAAPAGKNKGWFCWH